MFDGYVRLRHKYGFGVHSPFAYEVIKTAISPGRYGFYGYDAIDEALEPSPAQSRTSPVSLRELRKDARLLLRLLYALDIKRVIAPPDIHPAYKAAIAAVGARAGEGGCPQPPHAAGEGNEERTALFIPRGSAVVAPDSLEPDITLIQFNCRKPDVTPYLSMPNGLILYSPTKLLVHPRSEMALTVYAVRF